MKLSILYFFLSVFLILSNPLTGEEKYLICSNCGNHINRNLSTSEKEPFCPLCGSTKIHIEASREKKTASLFLELRYFGTDISGLPPYGLVYLGDRLLGRLQKEGSTYTLRIGEIPPGVHDLRVRLRFFRLFGLQPHYAWKKFAYVGFRPEETTELRYRWRHHRDFGRGPDPADKGEETQKQDRFEVME